MNNPQVLNDKKFPKYCEENLLNMFMFALYQLMIGMYTGPPVV